MLFQSDPNFLRAERPHPPERTEARAGAAKRCDRGGWTRTVRRGMVGPSGTTRATRLGESCGG
jgi:hypothetical protein